MYKTKNPCLRITALAFALVLLLGVGAVHAAAASEVKDAATLELYRGQPSDNERFEVSNLFPGDSITKYFSVKASHSGEAELFFRADITEQTKSLADVLQIRVTRLETGKVLYNGSFAEIDGKEFSEILPASSGNETIASYRIDVSLDTSVGNEYQAAMLKADLTWHITGELESPKTGDFSNPVLFLVLAVASLAVLLVLIVRRKGDARNG